MIMQLEANRNTYDSRTGSVETTGMVLCSTPKKLLCYPIVVVGD